jgi:DNA-binding response OmpR family regulator
MTAHARPAGPARQNVLIVEDEESIGLLLESTLEAEGYATERRSDGASALSRLAEGGIDLLLLDQHLPDMLGTSVLAELRATSSHHPPVVMVTAHGDIELAVQALKAGAMDYLVKDTDLTFLSMLPRTVISALDRASLKQRNRALVSELRRNEERLRNIFQRSPIGILLLDRHGRVVSANAASARLFGLTHPSELEGFRLVDGLDVGDAFAAIDLERSDGSGISQERSLTVDFAALGAARLPRMRSSGQAQVELLLTRLAADGEARAVRAMAQLHDVSSRYNAEQALEQAQERLHGLQDLLGVLGNCRLLRNDQERWQRLEELLAGVVDDRSDCVEICDESPLGEPSDRSGDRSQPSA